MNNDLITQRLIAHIVDTHYAKLSDTATRAARVFILDSLGVALSGTRVPLVEDLKSIASAWGQGDAARIWGSGERVPVVTAAFVNGYQIHNQEWDCVHEPAVVHPMAVVLSTLIAWAEARGGIDGRKLITACSVAVDVAAGIGVAARNKLRFFRPAMCGALGATAGLANLLELDATTTRSALGLAYSQLSGTMQAHVEGSAVLPMQIGFNTRAALLAIDLATRGIEGPKHFLEGPFGYFSLIDPDWDPRSFDHFGERPAIADISHKPFPSGRATHGGVDGLLSLQARHGFTAAQLEQATVHAPALVVQLVDRPAEPHMSPAYARLCLPYVAATALLSGDVDVLDFEPTALQRVEHLALAKKIRVVRDDNPSLNALAPQRVSVKLVDGQEHAIDLPAVLGAPGRPLDHARHIAKFRRAAASARYAMPPAQIDSIIELVEDLPDLADIRVLVDAISPRST
jgi:2-methylcitrate dehydratase PrpD